MRTLSALKLLEKSSNLEPAFVKDEPCWDKAKRAADKSGADDIYAFANWWYHQHCETKECGEDTKESEPWAWGGETPSKPRARPTESPPKPATSKPDAKSQMRTLLNDHPNVEAPTFVNLMKSKGLEVVDLKQAVPGPNTEESNVASGNAPLGRFAGKHPKKESSRSVKFNCRFVESLSMNDGIGPTKFKAVLLQEGLGNLKDAYYYTREAIESAVPIFTGAKFYKDHPSASDEQDRPERSVEDILGYFEEIRVEENEGRAELTGNLVLMPDKPYEWARALIRESIAYGKKFPDKDLVGLSINASGDAEEKSLEEFLNQTEVPESAKVKILDASAKGVETVKVVNAITDAVSCDLVTQAGAGGRIAKMLEQENETMKKKIVAAKEADEKKKETEDEKKEAFPPKKADAKKDDDGDEDDDKKETEDEDGGEDGDKHDDAAQDKELIAQMLKKHLGDKDHDEKMHQMAHEAYQGAKEMGYEGEEAEKRAAYGAEMAAHMAKKMKQAKDDGDEDDDKKKEAKAPPQMSPESEKKESAKVLTLTAENAKLVEKLRKFEVEKFLESELEKSGLPRAATKKFRECLGEAKGTKEITDKLKLFKEAYGLRGEADQSLDFIVGSVERSETVESGTGEISFADCLND